MAAIPNLSALGILAPPYEAVQAIHSLDDAALTIPNPGTFLVLDFDAKVPSARELARFVPELRRRYPPTPLVFRLNPNEAGLHVARRAGRAGVRAVLTFQERPAEVLRPLIARPMDLSADVLDWLRVTGVAIPPEILPFLQRLFLRAWPHGRLPDLLQQVGCSSAWVRAQMKSAGLPTPEQWRQVGHALHAAVQLQLRAQEPIEELADALGLGDRSSLHRLLTTTFGAGVSPVRARNCLSWEWMMDRWLRSRGLR